MKLLLLRHGETDENQTGTVQGWHDSHLNERGHEQAKQAAAEFNENIDTIFCSDLSRCQETASYFKQKYPEIPFFTDWRIRELDFGSATGSHKHDHNWEVLWASTPHDESMIEGAESLEIFQQRVDQFLESLQSLHKKLDTVLVVTHGGTINRFIQAIDKEHLYTPVDNCSITEISI